MHRWYLFVAAAAAFALGATAAKASPRIADMAAGAKSLAAGGPSSDVSSAKKKSRKARRGGVRGGRDAKGTGGGRGGESGSR